MSNFPDQKLTHYLKEIGVEYKTIQHHALFSMEDLEAVKHLIKGLIPKNLFLKADKTFILVCTPVSSKLDMKALASKFEIKPKKLRFGTEEELYEHLKIKKGSVSIYCLINNSDIPVYLDQSIWDADITAFHPNHNEYTIEVDHAYFAKYWNSLPNPKQIINI
jgi:Ala-tRNA(Pro) deacylase